MEIATASRHVEAEHRFREALEADAGNAHALNGLGVALYEQGRLAEAREVLADAIARVPDLSEGHFNLGLVHLELGEFDRALACFEEVLRRVHSDADTFVAIATTLERRGEFAEAEGYFARAARLSDKYRITGMLRFSGDFLREIETAAQPAPLPPTVLRSYSGGNRLVALVTCDVAYLRKYGAAFANSFARHATAGMLLHLHVLDPGAGIAAEAGDLLGRARVARFRVTAEHGRRHAPGSRARAVWYTCARLMHLAAWLRTYDAPIVALDVDAAIQAPLSQFTDAVGDGDVGLLLREPRRTPWLDVVACALLARPTAATLAYLGCVAGYIDYFLARDDPQWHLDQCALYCTWRMLQTQERAPDVRPITQAFSSAIYHVGHMYDQRMGDPRYTRYLPAR